MGDVSEASLLDYIYRSGGKVRNSELLKTYKQFISHSDLQLRAKYREEFKLIIDRIAVCKSENGEKYLILKKKYRQLMQERECEAGARENPEIKSISSISSSHTELQSSALEQQQNLSLMEVEERRKPAQVSWCGPTITVTEAKEKEHIEDEQVTDSCPSLSAPVEIRDPLPEEHPEPTDGEDDLDKDSGSKSESEQDEECTGSVGSNSVALDPLEKEWIYSAACGRLSHLTQLLKQDASLANKKTALHWAAKHGKEDMAVAMVDAGADVNTKAGYTPLHIAALHGHRHIIDILITTYGAKENLRDYSGHLPSHYLNIQKTTAEESSEITPGYHSPAQVSERRNRKITSLFQSRKKWGSAEDLAPVPEERTAPHQLMIPAFRPRKFSR
ncbi:ankyrin repeat domain-containing protein SOWAHA-like isoform X3 [Astyanax mexicanus]|uniref:Ankyrin repeat domain-containing protein SOWAHA-like isoform X3 n=1 Tax=Astyanax mexicanus TaxID=7994 RepID=A0A8T2LE46_ASTMX|nr:ankyrin repeat domain-containing protein SOWAHA-like isoform X3 [Astyanax mexicanus]